MTTTPMIIEPLRNVSTTTTTIPSSNVGSFFTQTRTILAQWHELQVKKLQHQQQQQQQKHPTRVGFWGEKHQNYDEFDQIMEEDLDYQLKELERQELEQYQRMEHTLQEQQQQQREYSTEQKAEFEHYCMEILKQSEQLQKRIESQINVLQQEKYSSPSSHIPRQVHQMPFRKTKTLFNHSQRTLANFDRQGKHNHQGVYAQCVSNYANQVETNKMIILLRRYLKSKKYHL